VFAPQPGFVPAGKLIVALLLALGCSSMSALAQEKYALLAGINDYPAPINPLHGCVNDMNNLRAVLAGQYGFQLRNVNTLFNAQATRANILNGIDEAEARIKRGDVFVFGYSGHGTVFPDENSEELDETAIITPKNRLPGKYDAALVPVDARANDSGKAWRNLILDDELYERFKRFTVKGCLVIVISDSCHSGTLARATHRIKATPTEEALGIPYDRIQKSANSRATGPRDLGGLYLTLTSSTDAQVSIEWKDDQNRDCGLFMNALLRALRSYGASATYEKVYAFAKSEVLRLSEAGQEPQMDKRFYSGSVSSLLFAPLPVAAAVTPSAAKLRVVVQVLNAEQQPLENSAFIIFRPGVEPSQGQIRAEDALLIGKTNAKGLYDSTSQSIYVTPGRYRLKVVCVGYRSFVGERDITVNGGAGVSVLKFNLVKE
jgi:hypothetical protein